MKERVIKLKNTSILVNAPAKFKKLVDLEKAFNELDIYLVRINNSFLIKACGEARVHLPTLPIIIKGDSAQRNYESGLKTVLCYLRGILGEESSG